MTIVLGKLERRAAKALAARWGVTQSEAIRRALREAEASTLDETAERERRARIADWPKLLAAFPAAKRQLRAELEILNDERDAW